MTKVESAFWIVNHDRNVIRGLKTLINVKGSLFHDGGQTYVDDLLDFGTKAEILWNVLKYYLIGNHDDITTRNVREILKGYQTFDGEVQSEAKIIKSDINRHQD